jgi:hypothetical protein
VTGSFMTLSIHQLRRLVAGYIDLDDCGTVNGIAARVFTQAALCGCDECTETCHALKLHVPEQRA